MHAEIALPLRGFADRGRVAECELTDRSLVRNASTATA
jgi:hypothetical protein